MTKKQIVRACEPWYPVFEPVFRRAWKNLSEAVSKLGIPTKVERANMMHTALRAELRPVCDRQDPVLQFIGEPDGRGLDCIVIDTCEGANIALRWARYPDGRIRRNSTQRQRTYQEQGVLSFSEPAEVEAVTATIGYTVNNDYIEGGQPAWSMGRLVLVRERPNESEYIHDVAVFPGGVRLVEESVESEPADVIRAKERKAIERIADEVRRELG